MDNFNTLFPELQVTEAVLDQLDINLAANAARIAARQLPVPWAKELVRVMTGGASVTWALGQQEWKPNPAIRYAAILISTGVAVWRCDEQGWMDAFIGVVTPLTTRTEAWKLRQAYAWALAVQYGLCR